MILQYSIYKLEFLILKGSWVDGEMSMRFLVDCVFTVKMEFLFANKDGLRRKKNMN
jgi:hypothetical protein